MTTDKFMLTYLSARLSVKASLIRIISKYNLLAMRQEMDF